MSTTTEATFDAIRSTLVEIGIDADEITPDAQLRSDLDIDSAELVEVVTAATAGSGIRPEGKALKTVRTVADLVAFVDALR